MERAASADITRAGITGADSPESEPEGGVPERTHVVMRREKRKRRAWVAGKPGFPAESGW